MNVRFSIGLLVLFVARPAPAAQAVAPAVPSVPLTPEVATRVQALIKKTERNLVFVKGGKFQMGDFGTIHSSDKLPYTGQPEAKPLHEVELDSFSLGAYKVTYEDFDVYTEANDLPKIATAPGDAKYRAIPNVPAGVNWPEAKAYCQWLGRVTSLPFDLPTEAQWEYAARDRGKFVLWATNNGKWEEGKNVASEDQYAEWMPGVHNAFTHPIGKFPRSPLGLYDMGFPGFEWMDDWFAPDYYEHSPKRNPRGPATGTEKVQRGLDGGDYETALTMYREKHPPIVKPEFDDAGKLFSDRWPNDSFRCALNASRSLR